MATRFPSQMHVFQLDDSMSEITAGEKENPNAECLIRITFFMFIFA